MANRDLLEEKFRDFLVQKKGVPEDNLGWVPFPSDQQSRESQFKLVIVDLLRNEYVAIFELKEQRDGVVLHEAIAQLNECRRSLDKPQIQAYLVFPPIETTSLDFEIKQVLENGNTKEVSLSDFPTYGVLVFLDKTAEKKSQGKRIRSSVDQFKWICFVLAGLVGVLFFLDATDTFSMSTRQLTLGSITLLLVLLPYAAKFKMIGIEFERYKEGDHTSNESS